MSKESGSAVSSTEGHYYINKKHVVFVEDKIKLPPKEDKGATRSYLPRLPISSSNTSSSFNWYDGLIKRKELIEVEKELLRKREEFSANMAKIMKRKLDFQHAWKKVHDKINSLCPYIEDINMKRCKTDQKTKNEKDECTGKEVMLKILQEELKAVIDKNTALQARIDNHKEFADYLTIVGEMGFKNSMMVDCATPCQVVLKRYQTLVNIREDILKKISSTMTELDKQQRENDYLQYSHTEKLSHLTAKASQLERKLEHLTNRNSELEESLFRKRQAYNNQICQTYGILQAIDNMAQICCKQKRQMPTTPEAKLKLIKNTIMEKQEIIKDITSKTKRRSLNN
ncbi:coiled-coil domain-containing protein 42 homolog [Dysidea avara]|uniref:coiled-coil domain-containing protein 42 homolog n=1 Tax=Dysidea avara TaxID=196820 RepID=UPI00332263AE